MAESELEPGPGPEPEPIPCQPWPSSPLDDDNLLSDILRRLPPRTSSLLQVSLVCKRWHAIVTCPHFLHGFRVFHRAAQPLLGVFHNTYLGGPDRRFVAAVDAPDRLPAELFRVPCGPDSGSWRFQDCRHGRALLLGPVGSPRGREALVWDPMTGARRRVPLPADAGDVRHGAVLCGCGRARDCCRSSTFQVVLVWWKQQGLPPQRRRLVAAAVYSSESGAWSHAFSVQLASTDRATGDARKRGTLAGDDALYWLLPGSRVLEVDAARRSLALIPVPMYTEGSLYWQCQLVLTEGGELGLAMVTEASIKIWKKDAAAAAGWSMHRSVPVGRCLPPRRNWMEEQPSLLGYHEESNAIFVWVEAGVFMIQLESMQTRMLCQGVSNFEIYPCAGFYTGVNADAAAAGAQAEAEGDSPESSRRPRLRLAMESLAMWHYADARGHLQGPFPMSQLARRGSFDEGFRVWRTDQTREQAVPLLDAMRWTALARLDY